MSVREELINDRVILELNTCTASASIEKRYQMYRREFIEGLQNRFI